MNQQGLAAGTVSDPHMHRFITNLAGVLADHKVILESIPIFDGFEITLKVATADERWFVGHKRNTLDAIEVLVRAIGAKQNVRVTFSLATHAGLS